MEVQVAGRGSTWGSICYRLGIDDVDAVAAAACRQLGFNGSARAILSARRGGELQNAGPKPLLTGHGCSADARSLNDCSLSAANESDGTVCPRLSVACT